MCRLILKDATVTAASFAVVGIVCQCQNVAVSLGTPTTKQGKSSILTVFAKGSVHAVPMV